MPTDERMNIWLYHINPKSVYGYEYGWDVRRPQTILNSSDRTWHAGQYFNEVHAGDMICVYMKNIGDKPDGVHIVGTVSTVDREKREFSWHPEKRRSARTLLYPITPQVIRRFFPRSYGASMQRLRAGKHKTWLKLLGLGEETDSVPRVKVRRAPKQVSSPSVDPVAIMEHGRLGEKHALKILRRRFPEAQGFKVLHVAIGQPGADHDIAVTRNGRIVRWVEVKTRSGKAGDPVAISEREIALRRKQRGKHSIFVVYLGAKAMIREVVEIADKDAYRLSPLQHWLHPGQP